MTQNKLSFVIPCYNSSQTIENVVNNIFTVMSDKQYDFEIVLINDCSTDNLWAVIFSLAQEYSNITAINLSKNFGQHAALMAGFSYTIGSIIVCLDDDGQTSPSQVFTLVDKLNEGYDAVFAAYSEKKHDSFRNIGSDINNTMANILLGKPKSLRLNSFFVVRKYVIDELLSYKGPYPNIGGLVLRITKNITNARIEHQERIIGKSGYTFGKLLALWLNGFTAFSVKPLRMASLLGFCISFMGFMYSIYLIVKKIINPSMVLGYTSMMAAILFVGGVLMLLLGLIGEYIGRIYITINNAPQYVIKEIVRGES